MSTEPTSPTGQVANAPSVDPAPPTPPKPSTGERVASAWSNVESKVSNGVARVTTVALWALGVGASYQNVKDGRYQLSPRTAKPEEVKASEVDADALLAYAQDVAAETDSAVQSGRDKTRTLLTLAGFLLAALTFLTRGGSPPGWLVALAFVAVAVAVLLLLRSLRVSWYGRLALFPSDLRLTADGAFKRAHAADLLDNARRNDGVNLFVVDVLRAAMRALLIGLVATLVAAAWPRGSVESTDPESSTQTQAPPTEVSPTEAATEQGADAPASVEQETSPRARPTPPIPRPDAVGPPADSSGTEPSRPPLDDTTRVPEQPRQER